MAAWPHAIEVTHKDASRKDLMKTVKKITKAAALAITYSILCFS